MPRSTSFGKTIFWRCFCSTFKSVASHWDDGRRILYRATPAAARETISGTLIGLELAAGLAKDVPRGGVTLVASGRLAALYRLAFDTLSVAVQSIDADDAVLAGLSRAAAAIWKR